MNEKKRVKVRKSDKFRTLVTETSPAETPIVFSNDGFYLRSIKNASRTSGLSELLFDKLIKQEQDNDWHIPYSYKIKKTSLSHRQLSVPHPSSQWKMMEFYGDRAHVITNYTSRSPASLRAPISIAASYYVRGDDNAISKYKRSEVSVDALDKHLAHSPSYFSYQGYGRLYKFFDSTEFIELERKFNNLWIMDIAKCFDSIYTHTILWAVKNKEFAKEVFSLSSFGNRFDKLMQAANHGETSGILIGPELSRIFSEIILQEVDVRVSQNLKKQGVLHPADYEMKRYVDDYFIFTNDHRVATTIFAELESELAKLKLGVNESKIRQYTRPFMTEKSKSILDAKQLLSEFVKKFTYQQRSDKSNLRATQIYKHDRLFLSFCSDVKACCSNNKCSYDEVSGYLISALKNRAVALMNSFKPHDPSEAEESSHPPEFTYEALALVIKCTFFLYNVAPSVNASYKLSMLVVMICRFSKKEIPDFAPALISTILSEVTRTIESSTLERRISGFVDLETQNILLAASEFSNEQGITAATLERAFISPGRPASYFNVVSAMYYIRTDPGYSVLRKWVYDSVEEILSRNTPYKKDAEKALTALDFISCPYIDVQRRTTWAKDLLSNLNLSNTDPTELSDLLKDFESLPWFVDWREVDLLNLLERKELRSVY